ncbi:MAG: copper-binding protein [Polaromonas sp.]|uniref:copper-binding protein n=1 Tax=Polaromonas sp. TaxID=1869339 RepID=UPI0017BEDF4E|nr:copper-binding protein [Polaromonas sp.]MBA3592220.1 copper-binding protein [Polaromonas sp.]
MKRFTILIAALLTSAAFAHAALPTTEAEVRKVDKDAGKITLKHGEIKNLDMPPMSMVFQVQDKALLDKVKAGDKISFTADKINGAYTVLTIVPESAGK